MNSNNLDKTKIINLYKEKNYQGVHEFKPEYRGDCYTAYFEGSHPKAIENNIKN